MIMFHRKKKKELHQFQSKKQNCKVGMVKKKIGLPSGSRPKKKKMPQALQKVKKPKKLHQWGDHMGSKRRLAERVGIPLQRVSEGQRKGIKLFHNMKVLGEDYQQHQLI